MRNFLCVLTLLFAAATAGAAPPTTPLEVVNLRMQLYNEHDSAGMLALYSPEARVYAYPDRLLGKGKEHLRRVFAEIFADADVRVRIEAQIAIDAYVINHEIVSYAGKPTRYVSIYEVHNGLIHSVRFIRDVDPQDAP